jgi:hypothetical protein
LKASYARTGLETFEKAVFHKFIELVTETKPSTELVD